MRTLIITGGKINKEFVHKHILIDRYKLIIAVDGGLIFAYENKININLIIGDLDTVPKDLVKVYKGKNIQILKYNSDKDYTDTHLAINYAMENGATEIEILGGIGSRLDHTLANIHVLKLPLEKNVKCKIINDNNCIYLVDEYIEIKKSIWKNVSLIPLTTEVEGVITEGLKYKLNNSCLQIGHSIGISNEIEGESASIRVGKGILIVIESRD